MGRRPFARAASASAILLAVACNTLLGIDGDVREPAATTGTDASAPQQDAPGAVEAGVEASGLLVVSTLELGAIAQGGAVEVGITLRRVGYTASTPLGLRWSLPFAGLSLVEDLSNDAGALPPGALVDLTEGQEKRFRVATSSLTPRGAADFKIIAEDGDRRKELVVANRVTGHIDTSYGKGGLAQLGIGPLGLGAPTNTFPVGNLLTGEGADLGAALADDGHVYLTVGDTLARRQLDGGPASPSTMGIGVMFRHVAVSDAGVVVVGQKASRAYAALLDGGALIEAQADAGIGPAQTAVWSGDRAFVLSTDNDGGTAARGTVMTFSDDPVNGAVVQTLGNFAPFGATADVGGAILVAGVTKNFNVGFVQRRLPTGAADLAFGDAGVALSSSGGTVARVVHRGAARILVGGTRSGAPALWSVDFAGKLDSAFGASPDGGVSPLAAAIGPGAVRAIVELPSQRILVGGYSKAGSFIGRLTASGSVDESFAPPVGFVRIQTIGEFDLRYLLPLRDGSVLAIGALAFGGQDKRDIVFLRLVEVDQ
ncbi:MAG: hypothetical protein IPG50_35525 [Myxococcales bacterium]|nr:hypothetical protein [Myxococcales bacterium]